MGREFGRHAVEQRILLPDELGDRTGERVPVPRQRVGVPAGVAGLHVADGRLGDERPEPGVVSLALEERELLLGDGELGAEALDPLTHVDEASLEDRLGHQPQVYGPGARKHG